MTPGAPGRTTGRPTPTDSATRSAAISGRSTTTTSTTLYGSLVGSLDGGKTFFPVGTRLEMTILAAGRLSLYYWDTNNQDNSGSVTATVVLYNGPLP
jgi:hypothetical protein